MDNTKLRLLLLLYSSFFLSFNIGNIASDDSTLHDYIVIVKQPKETINDWGEFYASLLSSIDMPRERLMHYYHNVMIGFSAKLSKQEVDAMSSMSWFLHAFVDRKYKLQTTHTPMFLGLQDGYNYPGLWNTSNMGEGIIIGILDTGIDYTHPAFRDEGMPPPPTKWKGRCDFNNQSKCNNKLIGARSFVDWTGNGKIIDPPYDRLGHGTPVSAVAAGAFLKDTNFNGAYKGVAVGMAPRAHIAMYKVSREGFITGNDVLAAMDTAVADGVDILSLSIGVDEATDDFSMDSLAIGALGAIEKGVLVSCAAGNLGPTSATISNEAPWLLTVAASTTDRSHRATVQLGNGEEFAGESIYQPSEFKHNASLPIVYGSRNGTTCKSFDENEIRGKIVVCDCVDLQDYTIEARGQAMVVMDAGGAGVILVNTKEEGYITREEDISLFPLPASRVPYNYGTKIKAYIKSNANPTAKIALKGTVFEVPRSPMIAGFSSRGPAKKSPGVLKPDITGPGVDILAPFLINGMSYFTIEKQPPPSFAMLSGTSLSCPHLSGVAALIKKAHPDWSPAAIKSAIMTTAYVIDRSGKPIADQWLQPANYFAMGAGHVDAPRAMNPGLVYDIAYSEYVSYLCGLYKSDDRKVSTVTRRPTQCAKAGIIIEGDLNLPSITAILPAQNASGIVSYTRTVTNVGEKTCIYKVEISVPDGVYISVDPQVLSFTKKNEKRNFRIDFHSTEPITHPMEGYLRWVSKKHVVRSPISIIFK